jgi:DNA-binding NarL/FixJ family response regulator
LNENFDFAGFASSGEEAIDKIKTANPGIILMDIKMPGMDGLEATKQIKKMNPAIKIIIMSLNDEKQYVEQARAAGADGFINKSRFVDDFYTIINNITLAGISS